MNKELEKIFVKQLQSALQEFCRDFSSHNVGMFKVGMNNDIILENLVLKKDVLWKFHVPMHIVEGKIKLIHIKMPLNYKSPMIYVEIDTVDLTLIPISESSILGLHKEHKHKDQQESYKMQKLRLWEENLIKSFGALQPPGFVQRLVGNITDNMSIIVKNVTVNFQCISIVGYETLLKIKFDELTVASTDKNWVHGYSANSQTIYKDIQLKRFRIILNVSPLRNKYQVREYEPHILQPLSINIKATLQKTKADQQSPIAALDIQCQCPLILMMSKEQKNYLLKLNHLLTNLEIIQTNFHFRPEVPVNKNWIEWWKYGIQAIIEKQKQYKLNLNFSSQRIILMKRYINLYKRKQNIISAPWLTQFTLADQEKLNHCETVLTLNDLIRYREMAFVELQRESRRYFQPSKHHHHHSNRKQKQDEQPGQPILTPSGQQGQENPTYHSEPTVESQQLTERMPSNQVELDLEVSIPSVVFLVLEDRSDSVIFYTPENIHLYHACKCLKCQQSQRRVPQVDRDVDHYLQSQKVITRKVQKLKTVIPRSSLAVQIEEEKQEEILSHIPLVTKQEINDSFETAKGNEELHYMESVESDFSGDEQSALHSNLRHSVVKNPSSLRTVQQGAQRVVLIIEAQGIRVSAQTYLDGRVMTKNHPQGGFVIGNLHMIAPGYLQQYINHPPSSRGSRSESLYFYKKEQKHAWIQSLLESFEFVITPNPQNNNFRFLIEFLYANDMKHYGEFLDRYNKDRNILDSISEKQFKLYEVFFRPDSELYLHLGDNRQNEFDQYQRGRGGFNMKLFLQEQFGLVCQVIRSNLYSVFLEEYGEHIIPSWVSSQQQPRNSNDPNPAVRIDLVMLNKQVAKTNKKPNVPKHHDATMSETEIVVPRRQESSVSIRLGTLSLMLTVRCVKALLNFADTQAPSTAAQLFVNQNSQLLECIMKSQALNEIENLVQPPKVSMVLPMHLKVKILADGLHNRQRTIMVLTLSDFNLHTLTDEDLRQFEAIPNISALSNKHKHYSIQIARLASMTLAQKFVRQRQDLASSRHASQPKLQILSLGVNVILVQSLVQNHASLTDSKVFMHIPIIQLQITDEINGLLELVSVFSAPPEQGSKPAPKRNTSQQTTSFAHSDSILAAELSALFQDHVQSSPNCRHCVIKYRKTCSLTNVVIGSLKEPLERLGTQECTWFHVLHHLAQPARPHYGIAIELRCTSRVSLTSENATVLLMPFLVMTRDQGFFKDNITVHCTSARVGELSMVTSRLLNLNSPSNKRDSNLSKLVSQERTYINIHPLTKKPYNILTKLDERHAFYCRQIEHDVFQSDSPPSNDSNDLFLLAYVHVPVRSDLLIVCETDLKLKSLKTHVYFRLREISLSYNHPLQACTVPTILQNVEFTIKYIENAWRIIYERNQPNLKRSHRKHHHNPKPLEGRINPINQLDDLLLLFSIEFISISSKTQDDSQRYLSFEVRDLLLTYNLDLLEKHNDPMQESKVLLSKVPSAIQQRSQPSHLKFEEKSSTILSCADIRANFSDAVNLLIQDINLCRVDSAVTLTVLKVNVKNKAQSLLSIPQNSGGYQKGNALALTVEFGGDVDAGISVEVTSVHGFISRENIQELLLSLNVIFLILTQEFREYRQLLKKTIYFNDYANSTTHFDLFKVVQPQHQQESNGSAPPLRLRVNLDVETIGIQLHKNGQIFCKLSLQGLKLSQKPNKEIEASIDEIGFYPHPPPETDLNDRFNLMVNFAPRLPAINLIEKSIENTPLKLKFAMSNKNTIKINIDNIKFKLISMYLNELGAFAKDITEELVQSKVKILGQMKKPKRKQVIEELERQIKNQTKIKIHMMNSSVVMPENSKQKNFIRVFFQKADITINKHKMNITVPVIGIPERKDNVVVDYQENMDSHMVHVSLLNVHLQGIEAIYDLNKLQGKLFQAGSIVAQVHTPLQSPLRYAHWEYKTSMEVSLSDLKMQMDMGKIQVIQKLVDANTKEKSELFEFDPPTLDKVNIEFSIKSMNVQQEKYVFQDKVEQQYRNSDDEGGQPSSDDDV